MLMIKFLLTALMCDKAEKVQSVSDSFSTDKSCSVENKLEKSIDSNICENKRRSSYKFDRSKKKSIDKTPAWMVRAYEYCKRPKRVIYDSSSDDDTTSEPKTSPVLSVNKNEKPK